MTKAAGPADVFVTPEGDRMRVLPLPKAITTLRGNLVRLRKTIRNAGGSTMLQGSIATVDRWTRGGTLRQDGRTIMRVPRDAIEAVEYIHCPECGSTKHAADMCDSIEGSL